MRAHVGARRRAREHLVAGQAAQARDVGRVGGEQGHAAAQLLPRGAQQVAQVGLVRAAVAVLVLDLSRFRVGSGRGAVAMLILHLGGSGERRHSGAPGRQPRHGPAPCMHGQMMSRSSRTDRAWVHNSRCAAEACRRRSWSLKVQGSLREPGLRADHHLVSQAPSRATL